MKNDDKNNRNRIRRKNVSSSTNNGQNKASKPTEGTRPKAPSKSNSNKNNSKLFRNLRITGVATLVMLVAGAAVSAGLIFAALKDVTPITKAALDKKTYEATKIYYADGSLLDVAPQTNKKEPVELNEMSDYLKKAVISIEDQRFYENNGVDIKGLLRAVVNKVKGSTSGGSTITMQLSKMLLTTTDQTLTRKIKDIYYAYEMNKTLKKDEILELYLNNFFVGRGLIGAEAGAEGYFNKKASELTLSQAALLAGATKNPVAYAVYKPAKLDGSETKEDVENKLIINVKVDSLDAATDVELGMIDKIYKDWKLIDKDTYDKLRSNDLVIRKAVNNPKAKERQKVVLDKMLELKNITKAEYDEAIAAPINIEFPKEKVDVSSSVLDLVEEEVVNALMEQGHTRDEATNLYSNGGLRINTTIDSRIQDIVEKEYKDGSNFPNNRTGKNGIEQPQSAFVILDPKTGGMKAVIGGRNIKGRKVLNRATTPRQPGSTIKPLSVYTAAIDTGKINQSTPLSDKRGNFRFSHDGWNPDTTTAKNGFMTLREGLAWSSNTVAVRTADMLGDTEDDAMDVMMDYLRNFGLTSLVDSANADRRYPALTLGGLSKGVTPLEMASAYSALANGGTYIEPSIFTTITTYDGNLLIKNTPEEHKVVSEDVAYVMTDMLQAVVTTGTGKSAAIGNGIPVAGKTGSTNDYLDAWFVGYTPYYVGSTYISDDAGVKDPDTGKTILRQKITHGSAAAAALWSKIMKQVHEDYQPTKFEVPDGVHQDSFRSLYVKNTLSSMTGYFLDGTYAESNSNLVNPGESTKKEEPKEETPPVDPNTSDGDGDGGNGDDTNNGDTNGNENNGGNTNGDTNNGNENNGDNTNGGDNNNGNENNGGNTNGGDTNGGDTNNGGDTPIPPANPGTDTPTQ